MPIEVGLSRNRLDFKFNDDATAPLLTETVILSNRGQSPAVYTWETSKTVFIVSPIEGTIPPGSSVETQITFRPENKPKARSLD